MSATMARSRINAFSYVAHIPAALASRALSPTGVVVACMMLTLFMWTLCARDLLGTRREAYARAVKNAHNLMFFIEHDIDENVDLFNTSLQGVIDHVGDPVVMQLPPLLRNQLLFSGATPGSYFGKVFVTDGAGTVILDSAEIPAPPTLDQDRQYFLTQGGTCGEGLFIGHPYRSRLTYGTYVVGFSRCVTRQDDTFGGIVAGTLSVDYFRSLLGGVALGKGGFAAVIHTDGSLVSQQPDAPASIGRDLSRDPMFVRTIGKREGAFAALDKSSGTRRLYVFRRLSRAPFLLVVAPALNEVYASWRRRAIRVGVLTLVFSISMVLCASLLANELKQRQRAESRLRIAAATDALTGLSNRGTFDTMLRRLWRQSIREHSPISLLFVDVDRFKKYNDTYGHSAGDEALRRVAATMTSCIGRPLDEIARYGGEEFVAILPGTSADGARLVAEALRRAIADLNIPHQRSEWQRVTVSIGLATRHATHDEDAFVLVNRADAALYEAKAVGRNRIGEAGIGVYEPGKTSLEQKTKRSTMAQNE
jgi:diguanylate cyclase (GGDEF)-like protein